MSGNKYPASPAINAAIMEVEVSLSGTPVGILAQTRDGSLAFEYDTSWMQNGFSISPISLPLENRVFISDPRSYEGVFGVFADSMPGGWGRLLVDRTLKLHGFDPNEIGTLTRLSLVGSSGLGALEYQPATRLDHGLTISDLDELAQECRNVIEADETKNLDTLLVLGGSSGGARPKVMMNVDDEPWIIKFPASIDPLNVGEAEYRISELARDCGINMAETRLFPSKTCLGYFGTKRFDRVRKDGHTCKVHMASAAAILETSHRIPNLSYETLMKLTWIITNSMQEVVQLYRLMCFNIAIGNRDDHSRNFAFLYDSDKNCWRLAPAYDLTSCPGMNGEHTTTVCGKGKGITIEDLAEVGKTAGIKSTDAIDIAYEVFEKTAHLRTM